MPTTWKLVLEYDGAAFEGWQAQPGKRTIEATIEAALAQLVGHPVALIVAGRTDAGVHALGQVASFVSEARRDARAVKEGLNHFLPDDVACVTATEAHAGFDARHWAWGKRYRYEYFDRGGRSPLRRARAWEVRPLDVAAMASAAACLHGKHDWSAFRSTGCNAPSGVRDIHGFTVARTDRHTVVLEARGNGFLRHMVRIVAGTLADVGHGRIAPDAMPGILASADRTRAGRTAPGHGLTLVEVEYRDQPPPWKT
jgi:tRNA pseudouridine38-40 synthase